MTEVHYEARAVASTGMSFLSGRLVDGFTGEIVRTSTGEVVHRTRQYAERRTALLQAARLRRNFDYHLAKHGVGWEDQRRAERAAKEAQRQAERKAAKALRDAAPELLAALEYVLLADKYDGAMTLGTAHLSPAIRDRLERAVAQAKGT